MGKCPDCGAWDSLEKFIEPRDDGADRHGGAGLGLGLDLGLGPGAERGPGADGAGSAGEGEGIVDRTVAGAGPSAAGAPAASPVARPLREIALDDVPRIPTGIREFDRVLGGGLVPGSVVLLGGDPGIGKSTLLLQALAGLAASDPRRRILYVSSEESARQVRLRAERLLNVDGPGIGGTRFGGSQVSDTQFSDTQLSDTGPRGSQPRDVESVAPVAPGESLATPAPLDADGASRLFVLAETNLARIGEQARRIRPVACAIDSIQMVYRGDLEAAPGSVAQLRRCCTDLVYLAKRSGMAVIVVGHVTKDGQLAGPKLLEHLVDVVLSFEGDRHHAHRVVRPVKNRFGSTQEIGLFEMTESGLREVAEGALRPDPGVPPAPGTAVCPTMLGSRCLLAEVQALTATGILGAARRKASGVDANRLALIIAILEKHGGLRLADQDVFVSVAGGVRVVEPAGDLAVALAIAGVHYGRRLAASTAVVGEVDLTGRVRPVPSLDQRIREAVRRGFRHVLAPPDAAAPREAGAPRDRPVPGDDAVVPVRTVGEALAWLAEPTARSASPGAARHTSRGGSPIGYQTDRDRPERSTKRDDGNVADRPRGSD